MRRKYASRFTEFENLKIIHEHVEIKFKSAQRDLFGRLLPSLSHRSIRLARSMQWNEMKRPSGYLFAGSDFFSISITILSSSSSASNPLPSPSIFFFFCRPFSSFPHAPYKENLDYDNCLSQFIHYPNRGREFHSIVEYYATLTIFPPFILSELNR